MKKDQSRTEDASRKLHNRYHDVLRRRIIELRAFDNRCLEGRLTAGEVEDIHLRVRSLAGSGATYGYPGVSAAADPLDQALASPSTIGLKAVSTLVASLIEACEKALTEDSAEARTNILPFKPPAAQGGASKPVLLTVDDDPAIHDLVAVMFRDSVQIVAAYNGAEAIEAARRDRPDLILLDNYMPGIDGLQLLEDLAARDSTPIPVIMLTADATPREIMRAAETGVADYVIKPFDPRLLAEKIGAFMRRLQTTVMVAHGQPILRDLIAEKLRHKGLGVVEASNGNDLLALAATRMPELILLDQSMPGMESGGILHSLRNDRRTRHIPVLYMTAGRRGRGTLENLDTGEIDPVALPVPPGKVAARIMDVLGLESQRP